MLKLKMGRKARLAAPMLVLATLAGCSGQQDTPAAGPAAAAKKAPAAAEAARAAPAVSPQVRSMKAGQLREAATRALRENRMYAPASDNAVEYYLVLREKQPQDATVKSALTDLMPYTLIAAEQSLGREDIPEAQRLVALIERVDPAAPALPRLKAGVASGLQAAAARTEQDIEKARKQAEEKAQQQAEQKKQAEQQAREAAAAQQIARQQEAARTPAAEPAPAAGARRDGEAAPTAAAPAPRPAPAAPPPAQTLRPISTPAPRYPPEALRAGTSGEVLVEITVGTDGSVTSSRILRATPARVFDREALNAIKRWKFEPVPAPVTTRRTLSFNPGN